MGAFGRWRLRRRAPLWASCRSERSRPPGPARPPPQAGAPVKVAVPGPPPLRAEPRFEARLGARAAAPAPQSIGSLFGRRAHRTLAALALRQSAAAFGGGVARAMRGPVRGSKQLRKNSGRKRFEIRPVGDTRRDSNLAAGAGLRAGDFGDLQELEQQRLGAGDESPELGCFVQSRRSNRLFGYLVPDARGAWTGRSHDLW